MTACAPVRMGPVDPQVHEAHGPGAARRRLLEAAVLLFAERGYAAVSIRDIAVLAGRSSAGIAFHFGGKRRIHRAAAALACEQAIKVARAFPSVPGPRDPGGAAQAEAALVHAARILARLVLRDGGEATPLEQGLARLYLRELASRDPARHGPARLALGPLEAFVRQCIRRLRPGWAAPAVEEEALAIQGRMLFLLVFPHLLGPGKEGWDALEARIAGHILGSLRSR